jgi:hypothetical protein
MDMISHGAWGMTIVRRKKLLLPAFIIGALPDLISTVPGFIYVQLTRGLTWNFDWNALPLWSTGLYDYGHSLLGLATFALFIIIFFRKYLILIYPYAAHIFLDIFTHQNDILARLFYPWVAYNPQRLWGWNWWEHPWVSVINWALIIIINIGIIYWHKFRGVKPIKTE